MPLKYQPVNVLLDKGVVRRIYEFQVRIQNGLPPTAEQIDCVTLLKRWQTNGSRCYLTQPSANLLRLRPPQYAHPILNSVEALHKGRYLRRWARRLRQLGFTAEDAVVLANASFGLDTNSQLPLIEWVVTTDIGMVNNFNEQHTRIRTRFTQMVFNLREPYASLRLPVVLTTATALALT